MGWLFDSIFHSIRSRLIAGVVLIHIILMGLIVFDMMTRQQEFMQTQVSKEGMNLSSTLAANAPSWLISSDLNGLDELVDSLQSSVKPLKLALILDADGRVKASTDPSLMGLVLDDAPSRQLVDAVKTGKPRFLWHDGMVDTIADITSNGKHIGYARVLLDASQVQAELNAVERKGIIYTLTAIALGGLVAWLLVRPLVHHLERLSRAADNIAAGNLKVQLPTTSSKDEVSRLTQDFAQMVEALEKDISERNRLEENLRQINETLAQKVHDEVAKNREKDHLLIQQSRMAAMGAMARNIAHHWRQPLNALSIQLANIKDAYDFNELTPETMGQYVAGGNGLIQKMSGTIDIFRDVFLADQAKETLSLLDVVDSVMQLIAPDFAQKGIALTLEGDETLKVEGYRRELSQVILGLLENARDALLRTRPNDGAVTLRLWREGFMVKLSVRDNNSGIPADVLPHVFEPYFTTKEMGTGLGLYLAKMQVEGMGGTIEAANHPEGGAEFTLSFPEKAEP